MSYILDALKRADSERERGQVPGLHARPLPAAAVETARRGLNPMLLFGAVVALGACAVLGWRLLRTDTAVVPGPVAVAPGVPVAPAQSPAPPQAAVPAPIPAPAPAPAPAPVPAHSMAPQPAPRPAPLAPAAPVTQAAQVAPQPRAAPAPAPAPVAATAPASPEPRTLTLAELPPEIRSQLPALAISGATYSANPAHRMLIINGQVFHEGEKPTPELTLEQIQPKSVVLGFRGYRYSVPY